jgi:hypothetical protein
MFRIALCCNIRKYSSVNFASPMINDKVIEIDGRFINTQQNADYSNPDYLNCQFTESPQLGKSKMNAMLLIFLRLRGGSAGKRISSNKQTSLLDFQIQCLKMLIHNYIY